MSKRIENNKLVFSWGPAIVWAGVILFFSVLPSSLVPEITITYFDKIVHIFEFAVLAMLVMRGFYRSTRLGRVGQVIFSVVICAGYGMLTEASQQLAPGRDVSLFDIYADLAGISAGIFAGKGLLWRR